MLTWAPNKLAGQPGAASPTPPQSQGTPYNPQQGQNFAAWNPNIANNAQAPRPPAFQASYGQIDGSTSQQPNFAQRDAFVNNINTQLGQMQQQSWNQSMGAPQFNFPQMWNQAGQQVQQGWQNPMSPGGPLQQATTLAVGEEMNAPGGRPPAWQTLGHMGAESASPEPRAMTMAFPESYMPPDAPPDARRPGPPPSPGYFSSPEFSTALQQIASDPRRGNAAAWMDSNRTALNDAVQGFQSPAEAYLHHYKVANQRPDFGKRMTPEQVAAATQARQYLQVFDGLAAYGGLPGAAGAALQEAQSSAGQWQRGQEAQQKAQQSQYYGAIKQRPPKAGPQNPATAAWEKLSKKGGWMTPADVKAYNAMKAEQYEVQMRNSGQALPDWWGPGGIPKK